VVGHDENRTGRNVDPATGKVAKVNLAIEKGAREAFHTEFYRTQD